MRWLITLFVCQLFAPGLHAQEAPWAKEISLLISQGKGTDEGRAAWDRIVAAGPRMLPHLLAAMNESSVVGANWLRTALERILEKEGTLKTLDLEPFLAFVNNPQNKGRARRLALDVVETAKPGTATKFFAEPARREDPEFRFEAVGLALNQARATLKNGDKAKALSLFKQCLESARDVQQVRDAAAGLQELGVTVSVGRHLGFLMDWYLVGPLDGMGQKGFHLSYPPEKQVNLKEKVQGQGKNLVWKYYKVKEAAPTSNTKHQALVNLREAAALGDADDAVAFAYTEFTIDKAQKAEFRGAADDNLTVWVNGQKAFAFEEYRNGVRLDRHRFTVDLRAGKNTVLAKIVQTAAPNPEPNWEFFLRVVDATGRGLPMDNLITPK